MTDIDTGVLTRVLNKLKDSGELTNIEFDKILANMKAIRESGKTAPKPVWDSFLLLRYVLSYAMIIHRDDDPRVKRMLLLIENGSKRGLSLANALRLQYITFEEMLSKF